MEIKPFVKPYPLGFRFSPTEEELILYYLRRKNDGLEKYVNNIREIDVSKQEPWDLPEKSIIPSSDEWYFFSPRGGNYPKGGRSRRATEFGYWKTSGKEKDVKSGARVVGSRRTLVFYKGHAPNGEKTEWIMHEYSMSGAPEILRCNRKLPALLNLKESFVICRVRNPKYCESKCSDIPPKELKQSLTGESSTSTFVSNLEHSDSNFEHRDMVQGLTPLYRCTSLDLVDRFDPESEYKKSGNLTFQDESCSSPKFRGNGGVTDVCFADMNEDIMMVDESSDVNLLENNIGKDDLMDFKVGYGNDEFMDSKFEQPPESFPLATPTYEEERPFIKIRTRKRDKPLKPLPFQGTAPRRIRMQKWQDIDDEPSVEASCIGDKMYHIGTQSAEFPRCLGRAVLLVVLSLGLVFLAALFAGILQRTGV